MVDITMVYVIAFKPLPTADGDFHEVTVREQVTGKWGTLTMSDLDLRKRLGDCYMPDLIDIDRELVTWRE